MLFRSLSYQYAASGGCGADAAAGADGNRTGFTDAHTVGGVTSTWTTGYCYDNADRLTGTSISNPQTGAAPLAGTGLNMTGPSPTLAYDAHGNTTSLADETLQYDAADRETQTTLADGTTVGYQYDPAGRLIKRTATTPSTTSSAPLAVDAQVSADSEGGWGSSVTTGPISTSGPNELLVALVSGDGPEKSQAMTVSGGGLSWTLAVRADQTDGDAEVWTAMAPSALSGVTVTSTESVGSQAQSLTVVALAGAGGVGATVGSAWTGAATVSLTTTAVGSMVFGVGSDAFSSDAQTPGSGQTLLHQDRALGAGADFWAQRLNTTTTAVGSTATISDSASSGWDLAAVEIVPAVPTPVAVDGQVSALDSSGTGTVTAAGLSTTAAGDVLVATVSADAYSAGSQSATVTGGGLTWSLVQRENATPGDAEVWTATAPSALSGASFTSTLAVSGLAQSLTVVAFKNASGIGASAAANAATGAPSVSLTTTQAGSMVIGAGYDWDAPTARTVPAGQTMVREDGLPESGTGGDFWTQRLSATTTAAGVTATIDDTAPTTEKWDLAAVEVVPAVGPPVAVDGQVSGLDSTGTGTVTTSALSTTSPGDVLVATVSADAYSAGSQSATVTGGGLTWSLVQRENATPGDAEVWTATAPSVLSGVSFTSTLAVSGLAQSLTVVAFKNASGIGASAAADAGTGAPSVSLTTTRRGSMVVAAGYDWDSATARTIPAGQTLLNEHGISSSVTGGDFWAQRLTDPTALSGVTATIDDTAPTAEKWDLAAVEVVPAATPSVSVDATSSVDAVAPSIVSPPVTTSSSSETLLAFVSVDGWNDDGTVTGVTGGGLAWSLVERDTGQPGDVEVWTAHASATESPRV